MCCAWEGAIILPLLSARSRFFAIRAWKRHKKVGRLIRSFISIVLVLLTLKTQLIARKSPTDLRNRIASLPPGSLVEVKTKSGEKLLGHIVTRTDSDFSLRQDNGAGSQMTDTVEKVASKRCTDGD